MLWLLGIAKLQFDNRISIDQLAPRDFYSRSTSACFPEDALSPSDASAHNFIKPIEFIIIAKRPVVGLDGSRFIRSAAVVAVGAAVGVVGVVAVVAVVGVVAVVAVVAVVDLVVDVVIVDLVVDVVISVFPDVVSAAASALSVTVSMSVTTGGVTIANRPH